MENSSEKTPRQHEGASSDITHKKVASTNDEAASWYIQSRDRLLDINNWKSYAGKLSAEFQLTDPHGHEVSRQPLEGDYIKIHLPTSSEEKFDWVRIEKVEEEFPEPFNSRMTIQVRPADPPESSEPTEHFFSDDATSSFFVERTGLTISASVRGRNEHPNLDTEGVINKVRNALIALGAMSGLNNPQWKALVKGLLEE